MPQGLGSVKRFGPRYGRTPKHKLAKIEAVLKGKHICPYCHTDKVKRTSLGIWQCRKCNARFTGKAYSVSKPIIIEEEKVKEEKAKEEEK